MAIGWGFLFGATSAFFAGKLADSSFQLDDEGLPNVILVASYWAVVMAIIGVFTSSVYGFIAYRLARSESSSD